MHNANLILFQNKRVLRSCKLNILLSLFLSTSLFSQVTLSPIFTNQTTPSFEILESSSYSLCYDIHMSPYAGGEDLLFGTRLLEKIDTSFVQKTDFADSKSMLARAWRLSEAIFIWLPINYFTMVVQHEVFGHGYRIRDIDHGKVKVTHYDFSLPPPYGSGEASTHFRMSSSITTTDLTCISMAGIESTGILANLTKLKWLIANRIDPRQSILYLTCQYNLNLYAVEDNTWDSTGHDLKDYVRWLQFTYPGKTSVSFLKNLSWINLVDPFTYFSLFAWFHFLSSGKETYIPMISIKNIGYLFGLRLGLTPFGAEIFFENYILKKNIPYYFYLKAGSHANNNYFGFGIFAPNLWTFRKLTLGSRLDFWRQPQLLLHQGNLPIFRVDFSQNPKTNPLYSSQERHEKSIGISYSMIASYRFHPRLEFQGEFGYKTEGFLPGYSLKAFPTVRISYLSTF